MKWSPEDIIAIILALCIPLTLLGHMVEVLLGIHVSSIPEQFQQITSLWLDFLKVLSGGLLVWISRDSTYFKSRDK